MPSHSVSRVSTRVLLVSTCIVLLSAAALVVCATQQAHSTDFVAHYTAGRLLLNSPHDLYSLRAQAREQAFLSPRFSPWAHPAPEALLFVPLCLLPFEIAFAVWATIGLLMLGLVGYLLRDRIAAIGPSGIYLVIGCGILPLLVGIWGGQDHILTLLLLTLAFLSAERERDLEAGLWLGLALIRWQFTLPLLIMFLVARRWRVLSAACSVAIGMITVSFLFVGRELVKSYREIIVFLAVTHDPVNLSKMPTLRGLFSLIPIPHGSTLAPALALALLLFCARLWWRMRMPFAVLFGSTVILLLATDMHGFLYQLGLLPLPLILLLTAGVPGIRQACLGFAASVLAVALSQTSNYALLAISLLAVWSTVTAQGRK